MQTVCIGYTNESHHYSQGQSGLPHSAPTGPPTAPWSFLFFDPVDRDLINVFGWNFHNEDIPRLAFERFSFNSELLRIIQF